MKSFVFFACVIFACLVIGSQAAEFAEIVEAKERSISSLVADKLEAIKLQMPCGWPQYGIPPLAPLEISHKAINLDGGEFSANGELNNFVLLGLNEFIIEQLTISAITRKCTWRFVFPSVNFTTDYEMDVGSGWRYKREGGAFFALEDLVISGTAKYSLGLIGNMRIKEFKVYISVGNVKSNIENLSKYKFINRKMNEIVEEWVMLAINDNTDYIAELSNDFVVPLANEFIGDRTLSDLVGGGGSSNNVNGKENISPAEECNPAGK